VFLFLIGASGIVFHVLHWRTRRRLHVTAQPGVIGTAVAMTAHSGFGTRLLPYDTTEEIERKLHGLRFHIDRRTGGIVAEEVYDDDDDDVEEDGKMLLGGKSEVLLSSSDVHTPPLYNPYAGDGWK
jgi:hypothetical protein